MDESRLERAAARLGSVYTELVRAKQVPMGAWALPNWIEPKRLRPLGGFGLGFKVDQALQSVYLGHLARSYQNVSLYYPHKAYEADLQVFQTALEPALARVTNESLLRQTQELRKLYKRFSRPGVEDNLHEAAIRIRDTSGGGLGPTPEDLLEINSKRKVPLIPGSSGSNRDQHEFMEGRNPVTRKRVLKALRAERDALEAQNAEPMDPREARAKEEANEISSLLAAIAVHPNAVKLLDVYAQSPLKGTERLLAEVAKAVEATIDLHRRLTKDEPDDAWGYAPLVISAVAQLRLHEVSGLPEFTVAMGRLLAQTRTDAIIGIASMLMIGLTIAFSGPLGAVVVGVLDLALAGTDAALTLLRMHEQEIAATSTDFTAEEQKLAEHAHEEDAALSVAGAFLSAIALTSSAKQLLKTRPRAPEMLKSEVGAAKVATQKPDLSVPPSEKQSRISSNQMGDARATTDRGITERSTEEIDTLNMSKKPSELPPGPLLKIETNVRLSGDTAGTGGIKKISGQRHPDGSLEVTIYGELKDPIPRDKAPNYNRDLPTGSQIGLPDYEIAHAWGPGFGDEARDGLMYAPREFNQLFQNQKMEKFLRDLHSTASKSGATVQVTVRVEGYPLRTWRGHEMLKEATYQFEVVSKTGQRTPRATLTISSSAPGLTGRISVAVDDLGSGLW